MLHYQNYGKVIMDLLQILQPQTFGGSTLSVYAYFSGDKIKSGSDFLTVLLKDSTGDAIEKLMSSKTDQWIQEAIKLARENLFDKSGKFITKPSHISEEEWAKLPADKKAEASTEGTALYKEYKSRHIQEIDQNLLDSTTRLNLDF